MNLAVSYQHACTTPSDIFEHCPVFVDLVRQLEAQTVIELGTRGGVSTIAWLYGLTETDGHLWSVDIDPAPEFEHDRWTFIQGDDLSRSVLDQLPDNADIVFIDTSHTYEDTLAELNVYLWKVRAGGKIVLHDTELRRPFGIPDQKPFPVRRAVDLFCAEEALPVEFLANCNGLGIISIPEA